MYSGKIAVPPGGGGIRMLISTALLLDSNIRNSVCTPAKLPCRRVIIIHVFQENNNKTLQDCT
jgi:hypothetical protein